MPKVKINLMFKRKPAMFLPVTLIVVLILLILSSALLTMVMANLKRSNLYNKQISATNIAEAGVNYYLWHLAHDSSDYFDGHTGDLPNSDGFYGPYRHDYSNSLGETVGYYELYIRPPQSNSTTIQVRSVGHVNGANLSKSILTRLTMPYFSQYFLLSFNDETWIGDQETVNGPVHSNNPEVGIRNEGVVGQTTATCIDHYQSPSDDGNEHDCIWGTGTFEQGSDYPVDQLNVADINYSGLKTSAGTSGNNYYPETVGSYNGYHLILHTDSYDLKKVKTTTNHRGNTPDGRSENFPDEIRTEDNYLSNQLYPENGLMFFEDDVWIEGTVNNHRISVVAAKPSENRTAFLNNIYIVNNLTYQEKNDQTKIGLIAQKRIVLSYNVPNNLNIDAAMLTKNDYIFFPDYTGRLKSTLNIFGSMAHRGGLVFTWVSGSTILSGFPTTHYDFDTDLVFDPPPYFPKSGSYQISSWQENPNF